MDDTPTFASSPHQPAGSGTGAGRTITTHRSRILATLQEAMAAWGERLRLRRDLAHKLKSNPHLIDDIGLTRQQAEAEIAKPFWRP